MNAIYKKEMRILWPMFGVTLAVTIASSCLFKGNDAAGIVTALFAGCCVLVGAASFGVEFQSGTMPQLLSQPVSRRQIWLEKMLPLGVALSLAYLFTILAVYFIVTGEGKPLDFGDFAGTAAMLAVCAFFSAPCITLFARDFMGGVAFTLACPGAICAMFAIGVALTENFSPMPLTSIHHSRFDEAVDCHPLICILVPISIYSLILYWVGYKRFRGLEAREGLMARELVISTPDFLRTPFSNSTQQSFRSRRGPISSLIIKEMHLHTVSHIFAVLFFVAFISATIRRVTRPDASSGFVLITLGIPLVGIPAFAGLVTVADERNSGTCLWQSMLPVSSKLQASIKIIVSVFLCFLFGLVMPALMILGALLYFKTSWSELSGDGNDPVWSVAIAATSYCTCFGLSLFASSVSSDLAKAAALGFGLFAAVSLAMSAGWHVIEGDVMQAKHVNLFFLMMIFLAVFLVGLTCLLAFINCQITQVSKRRKLIQSALVVILFFFASATTKAIFLMK